MILTLYYMAATWVQAWRLGSLKARLSKYIAANYSVVLYKMPENVLTEQDITGPCLVTSLNMSTTRVCEVLQLDGPLRLCSLFPSQTLFLSNWVAAHDYSALDETNENALSTNGSATTSESNGATRKLDELKLLLEAQLKEVNTEGFEPIDLQRYGSLIAWHFDNTLDFVLTSTLQQLTELTQRFLKGETFVNGGIELLRIQTVRTEGEPVTLQNNDRTIDCISRHLLTSDNLVYHVSTLKELSDNASELGNRVKLKPNANTELANQLTEASNVQETQIVNGIILENGDGAINVVQNDSGGVVLQNGDFTREVIEKEQLDNKFNEIKSDINKTLRETNQPSKPETSQHETTHRSSPGVSDKVSLEQKPPVTTEVEVKKKSILKTTGSPKSVSFKKQPEEDKTSKSGEDDIKAKKHSGKPPNILVYSESVVAIDNVKSALRTILQKDKYTIYTLTKAQALTDTWMDNALLVIACGSVSTACAPRLLDYMLRGGKLLCLCSDLIHTVLPTYKTAEVREHELVRFSYGRWQNVRMMHHIFCYQASPARKHFSHDSMDENTMPPTTGSSEPAQSTSVQPTAPSSIEVRDSFGRGRKLTVEVLGAEETWHTPSLLLATTVEQSKMQQPGRAVFSQVHLEVDPTQYESEEAKYAVLKESNEARLEILRDILGKHLDLQCSQEKSVSGQSCKYTPAFFLGRHELKLSLLQTLKPNMSEDGKSFKTGRLTLRFCGKGDAAPQASENMLPVMVHTCPDNFSTIEYFENLGSEEFGRLVLYSSVMTSSQDVLAGVKLQHGLVVIPRFQTQGSGRSANQWLSPEGCAMFSIQLHMSLNSPLGQRTPLVQHLVATAVVAAILTMPGYEKLNIGLKWPNDIYANGDTKIGGLVVTSMVESGNTVICNVGCGVNLDNGDPTTCINDIIRRHNAKNGTDLKTIGYEKFLALVFTEIESIFERVQRDDVNFFYDLYYKYWLHNGANIVVMDEACGPVSAVIHGIDDYGFLLVRYPNRKLVSVQPDGNSFDMLRGLIVPKLF